MIKLGKLLRLLFPVVSLLFVCLFVRPLSVSAREGNSLTADPSFTIDHLSVDGKFWHDRLVRGYNGMQYVDVVACSKTGETYALGRCAGMGINALAVAIRATGDPLFVTHVATLMANMRSTLKDVWRPECEKFDHCAQMEDGYLNFYWGQSDDPRLYGTDWHEMDEQLTHGAVSNGVRVLQANISIHPEYQAEVDFWIDYLENHFIKKNAARRGFDLNNITVANYKSMFHRGISHPDISTVSMFYDLYYLTGKQIYLDVANELNEEMRLTFRSSTLSDGTPVIVWRLYSGTRTDTSTYNDWCQLIEYGSYDLHYVLKLHNDGFSDYASDEMMRKFTNTITHSILANSDPNGVLIGTVCGITSHTFPEYTIRHDAQGSQRDRPFSRYANYWSYHAFAKWDSSGKIKDASEIAYRQWNTNWSQPSADLYDAGMSAMVLYGLGDAALVGSPSSPQPTGMVNPCRASDLNEDGRTDLDDYSIFIQNFLRQPFPHQRADMNVDGNVNLLDYAVLIKYFLRACS